MYDYVCYYRIKKEEEYCYKIDEGISCKFLKYKIYLLDFLIDDELNLCFFKG